VVNDVIMISADEARATAELSVLRERHGTIEVLREEKLALECRAATADELHETVVRLEAGCMWTRLRFGREPAVRAH
jgi:hypothetical protein